MITPGLAVKKCTADAALRARKHGRAASTVVTIPPKNEGPDGALVRFVHP